MANVKITELGSASTPLAGTELIEIVQGGVNKKVEVNEVGGGGGVTEFIELTDVPASYTGQASKVVAVKADETGLEFVAGGGTTPTLQEVLDEGKTATFTGADDVLTEINLGEYNEMDLESSIYFRQTRIFEDIEQTQTFIQKLGYILFQSIYFNTLTGIGKVSSFNLDNGDFSFQKQNEYPTKIATQNIEFEEILESEITGTELDVTFKPKPKFITGTYYLVDEDYVTNAIAGITVPDATPTVKGIAKLYTSLGSNTDGAVDQNTVNSALALKANLQNVEQIIRSKSNGTFGSHTGDTAETVIAVIDIDANEFEAGDWMTLLFSGEKDASAGNATFKLRAGVNGNTSDVQIALLTATAANSRYVALQRLRPQFIAGNLLKIWSAFNASQTDIWASGAPSLISLNPTSAWKLTVTAQLTVSTETASLTGYRIGKIKSF